VVVLCALLAVAAVAGLAAGSGGRIDDPVMWVTAIALAGVPIVLGGLVARRLPRHPAGPLLASAGLAMVLTILPGDVAGTPFAGSWMLLYLPFASLLTVLPDGRLLSSGRRVVALGLPVVVALFVADNALLWAFPDATPVLEPIGYVLLLLFFGHLVAAAVGVATRYRRAGEHERLQLRWIYLAGFSIPLTLLLCWGGYLALGVPDLVGVGLALMYLAIPVATTIALLRPDLVDVDRLTVAAFSVGTLGAVVLLLLTAGSILAGLALYPLSPAVAILAAVILALAAVPLYRVAVRGFGRLLYADRERGLAAVRLLAAQVEAGAAQPEEVEARLRRALRDDGLRVGIKGLSDRTLVGFDGVPLDRGSDGTPVRAHGDEIGALVASTSRPKRPPREVATAAGALIQAVRMRAELSGALREIAASRERLLRAGYEERRRLERDLHDGAQQRLVALGMALRVLQRTSPDPATLTASLDGAVAELGTAVAELRRIAHGVRPSSLDDGLGPALAELVRRSPTPIDLDVDAEVLPDAVGTTAYFVASEAIANAVKHSGAARISVRVVCDRDDLVIRVSDDGRGGASIRPTAGLAGLRDRVAAMGGSFLVDSEAGRGTTIQALLPYEGAP
jgi:signal transduction histidine kinase